MLTARYHDRIINSISLSDEEWATIRSESHHSGTSPLASPITGAPMHCKKRRDTGLRFFSCFTGGHDGLTEPETTHHVTLKRIIMETATAMGFNASVEHVHKDERQTVDWIADTYIERCSHWPLVFEVQWSKQSDEEFDRRTDRYHKDKVSVIWLDRHLKPDDLNDWMHDDKVPYIGRSLRLPLKQTDDGYKVYWDGDWHSVSHTVCLILRDRLRAYYTGIPIRLIPVNCWKCHRRIASWDCDGSVMFPAEGKPRIEEKYVTEVTEWMTSHRDLTGSASPCRFDDRYTKMSGTCYRAFICPYCRSVQGDFMRMEEIDGAVGMTVGAERHLGARVFGSPADPERNVARRISIVKSDNISMNQAIRILTGLDYC